MDMRINTLTRLDNEEKSIIYSEDTCMISGIWGKSKFYIEQSMIRDILNEFFIDKEKWYCLGAKMDKPIKGGLGEFIQQNFKKKPRDASVIAAILYDKGLIEFKGKRKIYIKKL